MSDIRSTGGFGGQGGRQGGQGGPQGGGSSPRRGRSRPLGTVVQQTMNADTVRKLSTLIGTDEATARRSLAVALPTLLAALGQEVATPQGAEALDRALARDHDGSVLNDIPGYVQRGGNVTDGQKILGHLLGNQRPLVEDRLGQATGLNGSQIGMVLAALAPLVLGALGQQKREENLGPQGLSDLLGGGALGGLLGGLLGGGGGAGGGIGSAIGGLLGGGQQPSGYGAQQYGGQQYGGQQYGGQQHGQESGGMMDMLGGLFDRDRDGSGVDDMMDMLGGLLGGGRR